MKIVLYQGRPVESLTWMVLPESFVPDYRRLSYDVRELVLRDEAEKLVAKLAAAVKDQHAAIDHLMARLVELDPKFRPSTSPVWKAVTAGREALDAVGVK